MRGVGHMVVESVELDGEGPGAVVVAQVRPDEGRAGRAMFAVSAAISTLRGILPRIACRSVAAIATRVVAELAERIDEISCVRGSGLHTRRAYGYHSSGALIAMANLTRGELCPPLPDEPEGADKPTHRNGRRSRKWT